MSKSAHKPSESMTPEEIGAVFAEMSSDKQARFWNGVAG